MYDKCDDDDYDGGDNAEDDHDALVLRGPVRRGALDEGVVYESRHDEGEFGWVCGVSVSVRGSEGGLSAIAEEGRTKRE